MSYDRTYKQTNRDYYFIDIDNLSMQFKEFWRGKKVANTFFDSVNEISKKKYLEGVFAKNERGYWLTAKNMRF